MYKHPGTSDHTNMADKARKKRIVLTLEEKFRQLKSLMPAPQPTKLMRKWVSTKPRYRRSGRIKYLNKIILYLQQTIFKYICNTMKTQSKKKQTSKNSILKQLTIFLGTWIKRLPVICDLFDMVPWKVTYD
jgi:hypothetical protein